MPFNNLDEFPTLQIPIKGKTYVIPSPDAETGLWVHGMMLGAVQGTSSPVLDDDEERDLHARLLGPVREEMLADGVPWHVIKRVGSTAVLWVTVGEELAERYWNGDQAPKAPAKKKARKKSAR